MQPHVLKINTCRVDWIASGVPNIAAQVAKSDAKPNSACRPSPSRRGEASTFRVRTDLRSNRGPA
jgi:hypothetical protein